jgi:hypothetical protein
MPGWRHSTEQIVAKLRDAEKLKGATTSAVCKRLAFGAHVLPVAAEARRVERGRGEAVESTRATTSVLPSICQAGEHHVDEHLGQGLATIGAGGSIAYISWIVGRSERYRTRTTEGLIHARLRAEKDRASVARGIRVAGAIGVGVGALVGMMGVVILFTT